MRDKILNILVNTFPEEFNQQLSVVDIETINYLCTNLQFARFKIILKAAELISDGLPVLRSKQVKNPVGTLVRPVVASNNTKRPANLVLSENAKKPRVDLPNLQNQPAVSQSTTQPVPITCLLNSPVRQIGQKSSPGAKTTPKLVNIQVTASPATVPAPNVQQSSVKNVQKVTSNKPSSKSVASTKSPRAFRTEPKKSKLINEQNLINEAQKLLKSQQKVTETMKSPILDVFNNPENIPEVKLTSQKKTEKKLTYLQPQGKKSGIQRILDQVNQTIAQNKVQVQAEKEKQPTKESDKVSTSEDVAESSSQASPSVPDLEDVPTISLNNTPDVSPTKTSVIVNNPTPPEKIDTVKRPTGPKSPRMSLLPKPTTSSKSPTKPASQTTTDDVQSLQEISQKALRENTPSPQDPHPDTTEPVKIPPPKLFAPKSPQKSKTSENSSPKKTPEKPPSPQPEPEVESQETEIVVLISDSEVETPPEKPKKSSKKQSKKLTKRVQLREELAKISQSVDETTASENESDEESDEDSLPKFNVRKIINSRIMDGAEIYKCRYEGLTSKDDQWHSFETMEGGKTHKRKLIQRYKLKRLQKKSKKA